MAIKTEWRDPNGLTGISCLSSDTKPDAPAGSICWETDTGARFERDGDTWQPNGTGGAAHVRDGLTPSSYTGQKATSTTAASVLVASGASRVTITNETATATDMVRVAFGEDATEAETNAASGDLIHPLKSKEYLIPSAATYIGYKAVANTPNITICQGV